MRQIDDTALARPARVAAVRRLSGRHTRVRATVEATLRAAAVLMDVPTVSVALVDDSQEYVWVTSSPERHRAWTHPIERSLCVLVVATGEELEVEDVCHDDHLLASGVDVEAIVDVRGVESYLGEPLILDGGLVVGSVCAYGSGTGSWTQAHRDGLRLLTEAVAMQLQPLVEGRQDDQRRSNRGSRREVRRVIAEHAALRRVATIAAHSEDPQPVFQAVVDELHELLEEAPVVLARLDGDQVVPLAAPATLHERERAAICRAWEDAHGPVGVAAAVVGDDEPVAGAVVTVAGEAWGVLLARGVGWSANPVEPLQQFTEIVAIAIDNAERRRRLSEQANTDPLTGLANRRALHAELQRRYARRRRQGAPFSVAVIDIDGFKAINDRDGHAAGDAFLRAIADCLRSATRKEEAVARLGGDEFCVVMDADGEEAFRVADRLRRLIGSGALQGRGTVSVGTCDAGQAAHPEALLVRADQAMYAAKAAGRDTTRRCGTD